jgi:hypothetical protein
MRRLALLLSVTFAMGIAVGWFAVKGVSGYAEPVKRTVLLKTELAGAGGQEGVVWLIEISPGAATGKHYHPGHEFVYRQHGGSGQGPGRVHWREGPAPRRSRAVGRTSASTTS